MCPCSRRASPYSKAKLGNRPAKLMVVRRQGQGTTLMSCLRDPLYSQAHLLPSSVAAVNPSDRALGTADSGNTDIQLSDLARLTSPPTMKSQVLTYPSPPIRFELCLLRLALSLLLNPHYSPSTVFGAFIRCFSVPILNNRILIR